MSTMTIGERIKQARKARDLSRVELARATGIPYPTLAGIENGDQSASTRLHVIASALNVRVEWLETGKGCRDASEASPDAISHAVRLDPQMIADTAWALRTAYEAVGRVFVLEEEPERFLQMYLARAEISDLSTPDNMAKLVLKASSVANSEGKGVEERGGTVPAPGTHKKDLARGARRKG
jgi:transcriptional regulator with XRE-family HTH domain